MNDPYTTAWFRHQLKGIQHSMNRCNADYADLTDTVAELRGQVERLAVDFEEMKARVGKLQETIELAREAFRELRDKEGRLTG